MDCSLLSCFQRLMDSALEFLWNLWAESAGNLFNLGRNTESLDREMRLLKRIRDDRENKVRNLEKQPRMRCTHVVSGWLQDVDALHGEVHSLHHPLAPQGVDALHGEVHSLQHPLAPQDVDALHGEVHSLQHPLAPQGVDALHGEVHSLQHPLAPGRPTFLESCTLDALHSDWVLGGKVARLLKRVRELVGEAPDLNSQLVEEEVLPDPVVAVPEKAPLFLGRGKEHSTILSHLRNEHVGIIGIYGMGGEGKTALLAEINHHFLAQPQKDFHAIWVKVSRQPNIHKIQEDIGVRLGYARRVQQQSGEQQTGHPLPENEEDRRQTLYRALGQKKFLLLLDDLWAKLDIEKIGVPRPHSANCERSKIVFTTRTEQVCADMDAAQAKVRVGFLTKPDSWDLFTSKMDAKAREVLDNNTEIRKLAEIVERKCGGHPLALITMGRAMSTATEVGAWRQAVNKLRLFPDQIGDMKDVLSLLKFSFDNLEDDNTRECLLYCTLFPEDTPIGVPDLVDCWVGEGFLDAGSSSDSGGLYDARDRGDCMIRKLKDACLLESGDENNRFVKMHDVVREMAVWLTGGEFDRWQRFMVCDGERGMARLADATKWQEAKRISVTGDCEHVQLPLLETRCANLSTILISRWSEPEWTKRQLVVTQNFWKSVPAVRVLDLSGTDLTRLSGAIGSLTELRHLDLSQTGIIELPKELGKLVNLRHLILRQTRRLSRVPPEAILTLTGLQRLDLFGSAYRWGDDYLWGHDSGGVKLSDLGCHLGRLEELSVKIHTVSCLQTLAQSEKLPKCASEIELLGLLKCTSSFLSSALNKLEKLKFLRIEDCDGPLELKFVVPQQQRVDQVDRAPHSPIFPCSLRLLDIFRCDGVKDLRWVGQLPQLEILFVRECEALEELLVGDGCSFPKLKQMYLLDPPVLESISGRPLLFPSLERLSVANCRRLTRLPVGEHSCPKIKVINGQQEWWDALRWDDYDADSQSSSIKSTLAPFFESY